MNGKRPLGAAALALALWLVGAAGTGYGQGNTWPGDALTRMLDAAHWRFGALRANAAFTLANAGYDSDIFYSYFGDPVPDWTLAAGAPVQLLLPLSKKIVLDISDTPQYLFYLDTERERAWNNTFRGQVHVALDRFYIQAGGGLADVRRRFSTELDINVREKRDNLDGTLLWQASKTTSMAFLVARDKFDYGDAVYMGTSLAEMLNRNEDHLDVVAFVQPSSRTRLFFDGQYGVYAFTGSLAADRDAKSYGVFGGIEFIPRPGEYIAIARIRGGFKVGYLRLDMDDPHLNDGTGFAGEADMTVDLTTRTAARLFFSRGFQFSIFSGATYYLSTVARAGLSHRLSRRATLTYDFAFGSSAYPQEDGAPGPGDRFLTHSVGLDLQLSRELGVALVGTFGQRKRDGDDAPRNRSFIGLNLTYGYPGSGVSSLLGELIR